MKTGGVVLLLLLCVGSCKKGPITETVMCGGNDEVNLKGRTVTVPGGAAFDVGGNCTVVLTDCTITAQKGITGGGNAQVTLTGGSLTGTEAAIDVGGNAHVDVAGTHVSGAVHAGGNAKVTGVEGAAGASASGSPDEVNYKKGACDTEYLACYAKLDAYGQVSGRVTVRIGTDGTSQGAGYDHGSATAEVQQCILGVAKKKKIGGFKGAPGDLVCEYSGTYMKGTQMMAYDTSFTRVDPSAPIPGASSSKPTGKPPPKK